MIQGLYQSAAAADGYQAWNDAIARNIASSSTPGYRGSSITFDGVLAGALAYGADPKLARSQPCFAPLAQEATLFAPGDMRQTRDTFEFAIEGDGFFRLLRPDGAYVYTRDGQFHLAGDGRLVSKQGYEVTGDAGVIQLLIDGGTLSADAEGRLRQGDQEVGTLSVFTFQRPDRLMRASGGFVVDARNPEEPLPTEGSRVRQGFLESGNVSGIREMTSLIVASNALQANHKVIQNFDHLTDRAVQVLGGAPS